MNAFAHASNDSAGPQLDNRRVLAALIDLALIAVGGAVLVTIVKTVAGGDAGLTSPTVGAVMAAWALYYYFALESGDGQTVGKKLMKLRVVKADGSPLGMGEVAVRTVLRVVDGLFAYLVGLVVMMATGERRQRLGDLAAGTMVADASAPAADAATEATAVAAPEAAETTEPEPFADHPAAGREPETPAPFVPELGGSASYSPPPVSDFDPYALSQPAAAEEAPAPEPAAEQPSFEPPAFETVDEVPARESLAAEPEAPAIEQPSFEPPAPAQEPVAEEPKTGEIGWGPAAEEEPAAEASGGPSPEESLAALMGNRPAPAEEPAPEPEDATPAAEEPAPEQDGGDGVNVRSVETVSAIDLIMGRDDEQAESPDDDDGPQPQVQ